MATVAATVAAPRGRHGAMATVAATVAAPRGRHGAMATVAATIAAPRGRHRAMATVEATIAAPRADVWVALVDVRTYPTWLLGARRIRSVDDGWPGPGRAFHHVAGFGPVRIADSTRCVDADPERRLELLVRARPAVEATVVFELADAAGGTRVTMEEHPVGLHRLLAPILAPLAQARNRACLDRLEDRVRDRAG